MDIFSAYREVGTYRAAAAICGTTPRTVERVIARHEADGARPARKERARNYEAVTELVAARVARSGGRITAMRLLPATRTAVDRAQFGGRPEANARATVDRPTPRSFAT